MKKKTLLIVIMFLIMLILKNKSYAAIEIKPSPEANANSVLKNTTVSNSYLLCQKNDRKRRKFVWIYSFASFKHK